MSQFALLHEEEFGDVQAKLYSYIEHNDELATYIKDKIQRSQQRFANILNSYAGENIDKDIILSLYQKLSSPANSHIKAFDVKRSTVTEFMAEFLLDKEFQCIFFEHMNKKINQSVVDINRHSTGIDITGIQQTRDTMKFVVAEVKASADAAIPCPSAKGLKEDIAKALDFDNGRLHREILAFVTSESGNVAGFEKYIQFLLDLLIRKDAQEQFVERVIIFPFLIRNNQKITERKNLNDYKNFSELDTKGFETIGIVWAVNKDIQQFVNTIYDND